MGVLRGQAQPAPEQQCYYTVTCPYGKLEEVSKLCKKGLTKAFRVDNGVALESFIEDLKDRVAQRAVDVHNCTWEAARASVDLYSEVTTWDGKDEAQPTQAMRGGRSRSPKGHATPTSTSAASGRSSGSTQVEGFFKGDHGGLARNVCGDIARAAQGHR